MGKYQEHEIAHNDRYFLDGYPDGRCEIYMDFNYIRERDANKLFLDLKNSLNFEKIGNRKSILFADVPYEYSGVKHKANKIWPEPLAQLRDSLRDNFGIETNSVLCNLYESGYDYLNPHSDDEPILGENPIICSISLGATRTFYLERKRKQCHPKNKDNVSLKMN